MVRHARHVRWTAGFRPAVVLFVALFLASGLVFETPAIAQDRTTLMDLLFGGRNRQRVEPPPPRIEKRKPSTRREKPAARRAPARDRNAPAETPADGAVADGATPSGPVEKTADAKTILVVGDFVGGGIAEGLEQAYEANPAVKVLDRTNGSSGLVRDDFYNWPAELPAIIAEAKPMAIVIQLGSNDRQQMSVEGNRENVRSDPWVAEYTRRAGALAAAAKAGGVPFVWVGAPPYKSSRMAADVLAFNEVFRTAAIGAGGSFVDVWDGFVDAEGKFLLSGSDISGQTVRLRSNDGINFTKAGKRKLAFYVERKLQDLLGAAVAPPVAAATQPVPTVVLGPDGTPSLSPDPIVPVEIAPVVRTPVSLADPELAGGSELLGGPIAPVRSGSPETHAREKLVNEGLPPEPRPGRAGSFVLPATTPAGPAAAAPDPERTSATR